MTEPIGYKVSSPDVPATDMNVKGFVKGNMLEYSHGQCIVVIPWSNHPPAIPRAMTSIDTPRRLTFWPHLSATMPWKPAGFANLSTWYHLMLGWDRDLLGRDDFACAYHAMGSWPLGRTMHGSWEATPLAASSFQDFRYLETSILTTVHSWSGRYKEMISATLLGHHLVVMVPSCAASGWFLRHERTCPSTLEAVAKMCPSCFKAK